MSWFAWIEQTWLSTWVRESMWGFPMALIFHSIGMGFVVGFHFSMNLRLLGFVQRIPPEAFRKFLPVLWINFVIIVVSGMLLLSAYPAKVLTNPVFYLKLFMIGTAFYFTRRIIRNNLVTSAQGHGDASVKIKIFAIISIVCWTIVVITGRLLAYTNNRWLVLDI